jgi:dTDP-4-amino-4,6-dideoxygalactose transaminase
MITTGEGGMMVTNDGSTDRKVKALRNYGASVAAWERHRKDFYVLPTYNVLGFNYKMSDIHASIGIVQMSKLAGILQKRRELAKRYDEELSSIDWLTLPVEPAGYTHAYQSYVCFFNPGDVLHNREPDKLDRACERRNQLMAWLAQKGIATVTGAQAVHNTAYYKNKYRFDANDFPNALVAEMLSIALPIYPSMTSSDVESVVNALNSFRP